jgi:hypothetical protein
MTNTTEAGKPEGKMLLERTRHRWEDNIKVNSKHESHIRCWVYRNLWLMQRRHTIRGLKYYTNPVTLYIYRKRAVRVTAGDSNFNVYVHCKIGIILYSTKNARMLMDA